MKLKFIKLDIEIMNDGKIKAIRTMPDGDRLVLIWIWLICLGMKSGIPGTLQLGEGIPYTDELLASELNMELNTIRMGLKTFQQLNMLEVFNNNTYYLTNFEKHQELAKIEHNNELNRNRVQKCREKKRLELIAQNNVMITQPLSNDDVTPSDKNTDKELDINKQTDINICLCDIKNSEEYINIKIELMERGWTGDLDLLVNEIGWEAFMFFWNNQLKREFDKASTKLGGGWITNRFRSNAVIFYKYHQKKKLIKFTKELPVIDNLIMLKEKYKTKNFNFLEDFKNFTRGNKHSDSEQKQLNARGLKSIDELKITPKGILENFLTWKQVY